jgi:CRP-like cAMP-binding protein
VEPQSNFRPIEYASPRPLAELLQCPPAVGSLLNQAARSIEVAEGQIVFRQGEACQGLYVIVSGIFTRRAERLNIRLALGPARPGDLVELGAALGDNCHTFTLSAQSAGSLLLLPIDALRQAFDSFPPLRMQLLEELAREVSRGYFNCCQNRIGKSRRPLEATP